MAACLDLPGSEIVDLGDLGGRDLDVLLEEEIGVWQDRFDWDFRPAADLLRRFLHIRSLMGCALRVGGEIAGYAYCVCEGRKGLIGDLYVRSAYASRAYEIQLLDGVLSMLIRQGGVRRVESQLMLLRSPIGTPLPLAQQAQRHERIFMRLKHCTAPKASENASQIGVTFTTWSERYTEETAHVLAASYRGHVDSEINDQYRSIPGARMFLSNITRYPGCGRFSPNSSVLAIDNATGRLCGMALTSHVAIDSGHLTQLCVLPAVRNSGIGYELLRHALLRLAESGCRTTSLTVTASNTGAIGLYESAGFASAASFPAIVWEGF